MCKTILKVEFASAEYPTNVADNFSKMTTLYDSIATRTPAGIAQSQQVTVYGKRMVV